MRKNENWKNMIGFIYVVMIFILGVYARIWYINNVPSKPVFDFDAYQTIATNIFMHLGHTMDRIPVAFQGMGYPMILGYIYRIFGSADIMIAKKFNVLLSSLTIVLVYLILIKMTKRKFVIYTAYTITVLLPNYIAYNNVVGTEVFFTFLFSMIIFFQVYDFHPYIKYPMLGVLIGVTALTKPFFMAYPVIVACVEYFKNKNLKQTVLMFGSTFIIMTLVIAPWTYRNYKKFGRLIPISYNSGYVLYINNNDYNTTGAWMDLEDVKAPKEVKEQVRNILKTKNVKVAHEIEPIIKPQGKKWILSHPITFFKLGTLRLEETFFGGTWDIEAWTANDNEKIKKEYDTWKKQRQVNYTRDMNFKMAYQNIIVYILTSFGMIYMIIGIKPMIIALFKREYKLPYDLLIPFFNTVFLTAVYFVYEGQARYNFPLLFLFAIAMATMMDRMMKSLE
ncbi:glycosyltransferase family 39 protein [Inediibacterium massiliense]|uniref:glycosyltransferase family 39 protein n=1 Tax=Inediibacterium massiliense TaxID=1658111 RepID=UPI0006B5AE0F|nr:glycosyltransferase family 39 protein [Inediibacterium massiliense]